MEQQGEMAVAMDAGGGNPIANYSIVMRRTPYSSHARIKEAEGAELYNNGGNNLSTSAGRAAAVAALLCKHTGVRDVLLGINLRAP